MRTTKKIELVLEKMYAEHASYFHDLTTLLPAILAELRQIKKILTGAAETEPKDLNFEVKHISYNKRPVRDIKIEAKTKGLISLDGLRFRFKKGRKEIREAIAEVVKPNKPCPAHIEGSDSEWYSRGYFLPRLKVYFTKDNK